MSVSRALYVGQLVTITTKNATNGATFYLPVQTASCEMSKPVDSINAFGRLDSLATTQVSQTTCKADIKSYLGAVTTGGVAISGFSAGFLNSLKTDALSGVLTEVKVDPNGFTMSGLITSIGINADLGGFAMADLSFAGVGQPLFADSANAATVQTNSPASITPVTAANVGGSITGGGCANSFRFSLDLPTENLVCLGSVADEMQSASMNSTIATKPPYKATVTVEGFGVDISSNTGGGTLSSSDISGIATGLYILGDLNIQLPNAFVTSRSFNNSVGAAGATYNYTAEDTTATFS